MARFYGGELGVWFSKKRKVKLRRNQRQRGLAAGSYLPGKLMRRINAHMRNDRRGGDLQEIVGWDDVRCRPIYFSNQRHECEDVDDDHDDHYRENSAEKEIKKYDEKSGPSVGSESDESSSPFRENDLKEQQNDSNTRHVNFDISQWNESSTRGKCNNRKQAYGSQKRRTRLLSDMAKSVLEQFVSPVRKQQPVGKNRNSKATRRLIACQDSDGSSSTGRKSSLSREARAFPVHDNYTPPQPTESVCLDSKTRQPGSDSTRHKDRNKQSVLMHIDMNSCSNQNLDLPQDIDRPECNKVKNLKPRKRRIYVQERPAKKQAKEGTGKSNGQEIRQPTSSTSLSEARAFFAHLDATHELTIE